MGLLSFLTGNRGHDLAELARRLGVDLADLDLEPRYRSFEIPKRRGGMRRIEAPEAELKALQRRILRRVLALLVSHHAATGFERGRSIVTNARAHAGQAVIVRLDLRDFFRSTSDDRVHRFFRRIGWNRDAARCLTRLCTSDGALPQGAPTSPRLANLVNFRLDARMHGMIDGCGGVYTRYADDLTFSLPVDDHAMVSRILYAARGIVEEEGYELRSRKTSVRRRHQQQRVTGLVVNEGVRLPRETRRWLRAIEHRRAKGRRITLGDAQWQGWAAFRAMVEAGDAV